MRRVQLGLGVALVGLVVVAALLSLVWTPFDPNANTFPRLTDGGWPHVLGTDRYGRDVASRLLAGARGCLYVGILSVGIAALIGVPLGVGAAWLKGRWADAVLRLVDVAQAFPALLLAILLAGLLGPSTESAMIAIGLATIPQFLRVARAATLSVLASDYVLAARSCGTPKLAIAWDHIRPNIAPVVGIQASVSFAMAILAEAALSYLGLGTKPTTPSWGVMLQEAQSVWFVHPLQAVWPGLAIALAVLGFNLLGDGLRDTLDPRLREEVA